MPAQLKTVLVSKAHAFLGVEVSLGPMFFLSGQVRTTYPSDPVLDAAYVGLGIRVE